MFSAFFGGLRQGRLARLPFLGFWVLLWVLAVLYGVGIAFGIGLAEPLLFDGPTAAWGWLLGHFGPPVAALLGLCCLLFVLAQLNLLVKRIRDMGLPGWPMLLGLALLAAALAYTLPAGRVSLDPDTHGLLILALLLIPSGLFARRAPPVPVDAPVSDGAPMDPGATGSGPAEVSPEEVGPP
ncbi:DUF805 domain-containing protein [uncultured Thiodictyon sp.]|uniref:DUF805 domain-containing protein n=1 Tax=uncultured Thiodictyon sp. TaxID=1846217 RepID=UPI0025FC9F62|nr:DUF805 domain-containing protein [uncultured Thiodictyon sp.]